MRRAWLLIPLLMAVVGCAKTEPEVVVYCALDREFAEPVLQSFEKSTGVRVRAKYDSESTKSVGLTELILREKDRPRCDVFWNNEILQTLRLDEAGLLAKAEPSQEESYPPVFRSPVGTWHGLAARIRVLLVNEDLVAPDQIPRRLEDLTDPKWKGKIGIAKPFFGTTATQMACLAEVEGDDWLRQWLRGLRANQVQVLSGNKQVAVAVGEGTLALGLTDTDDALAEIRAGKPVRIVYLDQGPDERGLLYIPNTLSLIAGGPNPDQASQLINFLLTKEVEETLAQGPSAQIPLHGNARRPRELVWPEDAQRMGVHFSAAARRWDAVKQLLMEELPSP